MMPLSRTPHHGTAKVAYRTGADRAGVALALEEDFEAHRGGSLRRMPLPSIPPSPVRPVTVTPWNPDSRSRRWRRPQKPVGDRLISRIDHLGAVVRAGGECCLFRRGVLLGRRPICRQPCSRSFKPRLDVLEDRICLVVAGRRHPSTLLGQGPDARVRSVDDAPTCKVERRPRDRIVEANNAGGGQLRTFVTQTHP